MDFKNKVVIITGGGGGIGLATAKKFAVLEACVILVDIDSNRTHAAAADIPTTGASQVFPMLCEITSQEAVKALFDEVLARFGRIDVIVNNAGLMEFKAIEDQNLEDWQQVFNVDLFGAFFFIKYGFKHMKAGSAIVNVSSIHALATQPMAAPYAAAKAALLSLTRSASIEGKSKGIRVNAILPGAVDTPMLWDNPNVKAGIEKINEDEVGQPEDIANAIVYLASADARFIEGASLIVDGGRMGRL